MTYRVIVLPEAKEDLIDIYIYIARHDSILNAETLLIKLEDKCASLKENPERGHEVPELKRVFVESFREIHFKPYRIIFQIVSETVSLKEFFVDTVVQVFLLVYVGIQFFYYINHLVITQQKLRPRNPHEGDLL